MRHHTLTMVKLFLGKMLPCKSVRRGLFELRTGRAVSVSPREGNKSRLRFTWDATLVLMFCCVLNPAAFASTFTVTSTLDAGPGSLRQAIEDASLNTDSDLIVFDPVLAGKTITLNQSLVVNADDLTFDGSTAPGLTISASHNSRVLAVNPSATVELVQLNLADGDASSEPENMGGGILNKGTLFITTSTINNSRANIGGGIYNEAGTVTITHTTINGNTAAIATSGFRGGGGVANHSGLVTIENSTISNNKAGSSAVLRNNAFGGGVFNRGDVGTVIILNTTVSSNEASDDGAGLYNHTGDKMVVISGTVTSNASASEGGGIDNFGTIEIQNTILAGNTAGVAAVKNCRSLFGGTITSKGHNLIGPGCTINSNPSSDLFLGQGSLDGFTTLDVLEPALAANGGPTFTHALVTENPALDAGSCEGIGDHVVDTDQRSLDRAFDDPSLPNADDGCDIGAFELNTEYCLSKQGGDWDDSATWNCGFRPTMLDNVVVTPGHEVRLVDNEEVKTLKIAAGRGRDLNGGGRFLMSSKIINVHDDLIIDGKLEAESGTVEMRGTSKQEIMGEGSKTFYRLHISNEAPSPGDSADVETIGPVEVIEETRVKQGQFRPDDESIFKELVVESEGRLKPQLEASIEVRGNLTSESSTGIAHNESTLRFTGAEQQMVTGGVTLKNLVVEKPADFTKDLMLDTGIKVEGETQVLAGQVSVGPATSFVNISILALASFRHREASQIAIQGDFFLESGGLYVANESPIFFNGVSGEQNAIFEGGTTTMNITLTNPDGLHARYAEGTAGTATLKICDSSVALDSIDSGDDILVKCGSIRTQVVDGPVQVALGVTENVKVTAPDETTFTATAVAADEFAIENSADSNGSLEVSFNGVALNIRPGKVAETTAEGALGLLRQDVIDLHLEKGIQNSLVKKLDSALKSLAEEKIKTAMNKVNAFIQQVQALSGKKFTTESGDALVSSAEGVRMLLNIS